jgi:hypothetical protein
MTDEAITEIVVRDEIVSSATAYFATYEDLSSRLVLLPFNDDDCTGAKVCSHEIVRPSSEIVEQSEVLTKKDPPDSKDGNEETESESNESVNVTSETAVPDGENNVTNQVGKKKKRNKKKRKKKQTENDVKTEDSNVSAETSLGTNVIEDQETNNNEAATDASSGVLKTLDTNNEQAVPVGYVLTKLSGRIACMEHSVEKLDERDFTEILSLLRDVAYPITLTFVSPECLSDGRKKDDDMKCSKSLNAGTSGETASDTSVDTKDGVEATSSKEDEDPNNHSILASREEAAKYAAQAASELRGRLTRWGFQAATKAAEAAQAVQEIREERQRKMAEEHDKLDSCEEKKCDASSKESSNDISYNSAENDTQHCHVFLQSAAGFVKLSKTAATPGPASSSYLFSPQKKTTVITNMSVITVRLSEEKACPIGSNGYKFQWYRSKNEYTVDMDTSSIEWCSLHRANYPTYQPSVSDIGYLLSCLVDFGESDLSTQRCILPLPIITDQSLFESAKASLMKVGVENCALFGSLKDSSGSLFRLRVFVEMDNETDSIAKSYIILDRWIGSEFEPMHQEHQSLLAVRARSDPSRPRGFELIFESPSQPNRYILDAPNRNARESLLIALGLASFTGSLSSLTTETTLLQYSDEFEVPIVLHANKEITPDHSKSLPTCDEKSTSSKNLYAIQLEAQMKDVQAELEAKTALVSKLQQKISASTDERKKAERELVQARSKAEELSQCQQKVEERDAVISEQQRSIKSLRNEKAILAASVEMRDGKIEGLSVQIVELQNQLAVALRQVEEVRTSESEQVRARLEAAKAKEDMETAALIEAMKKEEEQFKEELKGAQSIIEELNQKYACTKVSSTRIKDELDKMRSDAKKLKMERNTLKNKNDSLVRENSKLQAQLAIKPKPTQPVNEAEMRTLKQTIKQLQLHNSQQQGEITSLRSEKRELQEELQATRSAHKQSARYLTAQQPASTPNNREAHRMMQQCEDLESVIVNLKDHLDAKEMQINTLKEINETLIREIDDARIARK